MKSYKFLCNKCQKKFNFKIGNGAIIKCPKCNPNKGRSKTELIITDWLDELNISYIKNKRFGTGINKKEVDILINEKDYKLGIEIDGIYYHSEISGNKNNKYHNDKTAFFNTIGITIIHFFDTEINQKLDIVKSMILSKLNKNTDRIFVRKCIIKTISSNITNKFLSENHIQGSVNSSINIGLFYENELVSVMTFGKSRFAKKYQYELLRFATKKYTTVVGGFSKCLKYFKNNYNGTIITYCDKRFSTGNVYIKNGFKLIRESRMKYQKHKLKNTLENYNDELTEWENMQLNGYDRIWDCGNMVFESVLI